jgi:hypothetical protein
MRIFIVVRHFKQAFMETTNIRQKLIEELIALDKKNQFEIAGNSSNVDWTNLKADIQKRLKKSRKNAKSYKILAYILMAVVALMALYKMLISGSNGEPNLNKYPVTIFFTIISMYAAFSHRAKVESLEKQNMLLSILETMDVQQEEQHSLV